MQDALSSARVATWVKAKAESKLLTAVGAANLTWDRRGGCSDALVASGSRSCGSTGGKLCQFRCRDCRLRKAALQAD